MNFEKRIIIYGKMGILKQFLVLAFVCCVLSELIVDKDGMIVDDEMAELYTSCNGHSSCNRWWINWNAWSSCTQTCGGGTQTRTGQHYCHCKSWRHGDQRCSNLPLEVETIGCQEWCEPNKGVFNQGCQCYDIFYGYCCQSDCPQIKWCDKYWCNAPPSTCTQCDQFAGSGYDDSAYWLNSNECTPRCNWLDHWCWPGTCDTSNQYLASTCQCEPGFVKETPDEMTTKCQLTHPPVIETCRLGIEGPNGEAFNSTFVSNTTSCDNTRETWVNVQPAELFFVFEFAFRLPQDPPKDPIKHKYVDTFHFGIVDGDVTNFLYPRSGAAAIRVLDLDMPNDAVCNVPSFDPNNPADGLVSCQATHAFSNGLVDDGDRLCHYFKPTGSGYVRIKNIVDNSVSGNHLYAQTTTDAEKCFNFDFVKADHCGNNNPPCADEPLAIGERIQRHPTITAKFPGYFDPEPNSAVTSASGIEKYKIFIHTMDVNENSQKKNMAIQEEYEIPAGTEEFTFDLPELGAPMLFAIYLDTLDLAKNPRTARRFVLYDNISKLALDEQNPLRPVTANGGTDYLWQVTHDPVIVDWQKHFYNDWFRHTNHLLPTTSDQFVEGIFEQTDGPLPVSGTTNVDGILSFKYKFNKMSPSSNQSAPYREISLVTDQQVTLTDLPIQDGDTIDVMVHAIDINENTITNGFRMFIDSTPPLLQNLWLTKDGYRQLYFHNSKDLSEMDFRFDAFDPHSNLKSVRWTLGTTPKGSDIGKGALPVVKLNSSDVCTDPQICSCPIIGKCSMTEFLIDLNHLIGDNTHEGDHNREYFFWIEAMNEAHLKTVEEVSILVDDSPPEPGVVFDGPAGSPDRDFQSDMLLQWHWQGFYDHESGINKYHFAVGKECFLTSDLTFLEDLSNNSRVLFFGETQDLHTEFAVDSEDVYFLSVIAFNNAMDPSIEVCSNGILIDSTPPILKHLHLKTGKTQPSIACDNNNTIWHITEESIAKPLRSHSECERHCFQVIDMSLLYQEIQLNNNGTKILPPDETSQQLCTYLPSYSPDQFIFVPTDNMELDWDCEEPESQVHDFLLGVSTNKADQDIPDIIGYQTTHNRTHFKCVHCGLGEGQLFSVQVKVVNKAGLAHVESIGPVIIDLTPPVYGAGLTLETGKMFNLSWTALSFYDDEDSNLLTRYQWALGDTSDPQSVEDWQWMIIPHDDIDDKFVFNVQYPTDLLQNHDQDRGREYTFSVKAFNRAGLSVTHSTLPYKLHSKAPPSNGIIYHVLQENVGEENIDEVGFQEADDVLCARWKGFNHHSNELEMTIGVGTAKGESNIVDAVPVNNDGSYCFTGISLPHLTQYIINIHAYNTQGSVNVSSDGIFISTKVEVVEFSKVNDGNDCLSDGLELDTNVNLAKGEQRQYTPIQRMSSNSYYTLILEHKWNGQLDELSVNTLSNNVPKNSWHFIDDKILEYFKLDFIESNQTITISAQEDVLLESISISACVKDQVVQASTKGIQNSWTFRPEVLRTASHFNLWINEYHCSATDCIEGGEVFPQTVIGTDSFISHQLLDEGNAYKTFVEVCFSKSCIDPIESGGIVVDSLPAEGNLVECVIRPQHGLLDSNKFEIEASWDSFSNKKGLRESTLAAYHWAISATPTGGSMLTEWNGVVLSPGQEAIDIFEEHYLQMHDRKTVYLLVRSYNDWHVQSLVSAACTVDDAKAPLSSPVYDLRVDYEDLDALNDVLHSNQLGEVGVRLHNDEVDFSNNTRGIAAALQGTACEDHDWFVQEDPDINCRDQSRHVTCRKKRYTNLNVVQFRNMFLLHGHRYYVCVHASGGKCSSLPFKVCSNGFIVDTKPPLPGHVYIGHEHKTLGHSDNTSVLIQWEGFEDIESELVIPFASGIKEYFYAIGKSLGSEDTVAFTSVGISEHVTAKGLNLESGALYYMSIKACDHVDLCTIQSSEPVLVDSTPPTHGSVSVYSYNKFDESNSNVVVKWEDFTDNESGIRGFQIGVGSNPNAEDISPFESVLGYSSLFDGSDKLMDGKMYYYQVKAINRVGLWTISSSGPVLHDSTPPVEGYVRWGKEGQDFMRYTTDINHIEVHWGGFFDPHSGMMYYRFCVGTVPGECNTWAWEDTGLHTYISKEKDIVPGRAYYVTVEACNTVLLCTKVTSASVIADSTPPMPGVVKIGNGDEHSMYTSSTKSLVASWLNIHDPQSGIRQYEWCVGKAPHVCDVIPLTTAHQSLTAFRTDLNLPVSEPLFVTVTATNNAGLTVSSHSPQFIADISAPVCKLVPELSPIYSKNLGTQFDRSILSLKWEFSDDESPVWTSSLSTHTYSDSMGPISDLVVGDVSETTISLSAKDQLKDGNRYTVSVTSCNGAGLCSTVETVETLVDSSPPHLGGFLEPLSWENTGSGSIVSLSWEGFDDAHSGIAKYYVMISSTYNGYDLSDGVIQVTHDNSISTQQQSFNLAKEITPYTMVYLSIWAENGVGLMSDAAKVGVFVLKSGDKEGRLDIEKHSCDMHYCNRDCTCAAVNRKCSSGDVKFNCTEIQNSYVAIHDGVPGDQMAMTASSTCLQSFWEQTDTSKPVTRFEWAVGGKGSDPGMPIFDIINDKYWFDVELYERSVFCTPIDKILDQGLEYVYYVKAWHSFDEFSLYESDGVKVDTTAPRIGMGRAVRDMDPTFEQEIAFSSSASEVHVDWDKVFNDAETGLHHYEVSVGTSSGGNEIYGPEDVGSVTRISLAGLSLTPGFHYYTTVHAFNPLQMVTLMSSDGFVVDTENPLAGDVYSSLVFQDASHTVEQIEASWLGFEDLHSYIKNYEWAISESIQAPDNHEFHSVGLETSFKLPAAELSLTEGIPFYVHVRAFDAAGHASEIVTSSSIILDSSPPVGTTCNNFVETPGDWTFNCSSCDTLGCAEEYSICHVKDTITLSKNQFVKVAFESNKDHASVRARLQLGNTWDWLQFNREGPEKFVHYTTEIWTGESTTITPILYIFKGDLSDIRVYVSICHDIHPTDSPLIVQQTGLVAVSLHWAISDPESGIKSTQIGLGTNQGGFQLQNLRGLGQSSSTVLPLPLQHSMKVHAVLMVENNAGIYSHFYSEPLTVDWSPPLVTGLEVNVNLENDTKYEVNASWTVTEEESVVQDCHWTLGSIPGGDDLLTIQLTETLSSSSASGITLHHGQSVYATVSCTNSLGLRESSTSSGYLILSKPPTADQAYAAFHPKSDTVFPARDQTQEADDSIEFEFHGFSDITGINKYEYSIGLDNQWYPTGKADHLIVDGISLPGNEFNISIRAHNDGDFISEAISTTGTVDQQSPGIVGDGVTFKLNQQDATLDWSNLFGWSSEGSLSYIVYVGTEVGAANLVTGLETFDDRLVVTSSMWESPGECFVAITAVAPSGKHVTHRETIMY